MWFIGFLATFAGVGVGGFFAAVINRFKKSVGTIYAVCAGLILALISFEIIPELIQLGDWRIALLGFIGGCFLFLLIHRVMDKNASSSKGVRKYHNKELSLFLAFILSFHNLPMGIALGTTENTQVSIALLIALILHNIPEGMILFTPLFVSGFSSKSLFIFSIFVSLPIAIGAFIGEVIGLYNNLLWTFLISLTVGMIYMVTIKEVLPESIRQSSNLYSLVVASISFCFLGVYLVFYLG